MIQDVGMQDGQRARTPDQTKNKQVFVFKKFYTVQ